MYACAVRTRNVTAACGERYIYIPSFPRPFGNEATTILNFTAFACGIRLCIPAFSCVVRLGGRRCFSTCSGDLLYSFLRSNNQGCVRIPVTTIIILVSSGKRGMESIVDAELESMTVDELSDWLSSKGIPSEFALNLRVSVNKIW